MCDKCISYIEFIGIVHSILGENAYSQVLQTTSNNTKLILHHTNKIQTHTAPSSDEKGKQMLSIKAKCMAKSNACFAFEHSFLCFAFVCAKLKNLIYVHAFSSIFIKHRRDLCSDKLFQCSFIFFSKILSFHKMTLMTLDSSSVVTDKFFFRKIS